MTVVVSVTAGGGGGGGGLYWYPPCTDTTPSVSVAFDCADACSATSPNTAASIDNFQRIFTPLLPTSGP